MPLKNLAWNMTVARSALRPSRRGACTVKCPYCFLRILVDLPNISFILDFQFLGLYDVSGDFFPPIVCHFSLGFMLCNRPWYWVLQYRFAMPCWQQYKFNPIIQSGALKFAGSLPSVQASLLTKFSVGTEQLLVTQCHKCIFRVCLAQHYVLELLIPCLKSLEYWVFF